MENLIFFLQMRGFDKDKSINKINDIANKMHIEKSLLDQKYMFLSSGERKKISLIRCFAHEPDLIIMDEPMSGLDGHFKELFLKYLLQICKKKDRILIIVSHNVDLYKDLYTHMLEMGNHSDLQIKIMKKI